MRGRGRGGGTAWAKRTQQTRVNNTGGRCWHEFTPGLPGGRATPKKTPARNVQGRVSVSAIRWGRVGRSIREVRARCGAAIKRLPHTTWTTAHTRLPRVPQRVAKGKEEASISRELVHSAPSRGGGEGGGGTLPSECTRPQAEAHHGSGTWEEKGGRGGGGAAGKGSLSPRLDPFTPRQHTWAQASIKGIRQHLSLPQTDGVCPVRPL